MLLGTPIKAMLDGEVSLIEEDMYYTGHNNFDHGRHKHALYAYNYVKANKSKDK